MFNPESPNGLLYRVSQLEEQVQILTAQVEAMREVLAAGSQPQGGLFASERKVTTITVRRENRADGSVRLMYIPDSRDPDNIHHDVPGDRVVGRFTKLEIVDTEYEGEPARIAILHVERGLELARIRMNANLKPKSSVTLKSFLSSLENVPDSALAGELIYKPYPGKHPSAVLASVVDPASDRPFRSDGEADPEELRQQWRDSAYWNKLLEKTIARINGAARVDDSPSAAPTAKPTPATPPAKERKDSIGTPISFKGLAKFNPADLESYPSEDDPRIMHSSLWFEIERDEDKRIIPCLASDDIARKITQFYHPGKRLSCSGVRDRDDDGNQYVFIQNIEPAITESPEPEDLSDLIAFTDIEMERVGWTKERGRDHLKRTYQKSSRQKLDANELRDFLEFLNTLPSASVSL